MILKISETKIPIGLCFHLSVLYTAKSEASREATPNTTKNEAMGRSIEDLAPTG
jgi:hypothetical protein